MKTSKIKFIVRHNNKKYRIWLVKFNPTTCWMEGGHGPKDWGWRKHLSWAWHKQSEEKEKECLIEYVKAKYDEVNIF